MKKLICTFVGGAMLLGLLIGSSPEVSALPTTLRNPVGATAIVSGRGPAVCNCSSSPGTVEVCHSQTVAVRLGSETIHVPTGQSSSNCMSQVVPPGTCLYFCYTFECTPTFFGWHCDLVSSRPQDRPAEESDC